MIPNVAFLACQSKAGVLFAFLHYPTPCIWSHYQGDNSVHPPFCSAYVFKTGKRQQTGCTSNRGNFRSFRTLRGDLLLDGLHGQTNRTPPPPPPPHNLEKRLSLMGFSHVGMDPLSCFAKPRRGRRRGQRSSGRGFREVAGAWESRKVGALRAA